MGNYYESHKGPRTKSAIDLDALMQIDGVVAAGEFTQEGKLIDFRSSIDMSADAAAMCADLCAPVSVMFETLAEQYMRFSGMNWAPPKGWAYSGGEWTVAVSGTRGVFVQTAKTDFNRLFHMLVGDPAQF
jgi:roadblock/LC7 domain-containing protein